MEIIGHDDIQRELGALAASEDPPHALMLAGPEGTGRALLALHYARLLNCERRAGAVPAGASLFGDTEAPVGTVGLPCGECRPCRLIAAGAHPDVIALGPGDTLCRTRPNEGTHAAHAQSRDIRICQVRGLAEVVARYPFEANYRVIVLDPAERLGRDAAQALLKTLEEPPPHTVIALVTAAPESLPETIASRCRRIDVRPVPRAVIEAALVARGVAAALAGQAAAASRGRPGRAVAFASQPDLMGDRERMLARCARVAAAGLGERFRYAAELAERFRAERAPVLNELDAWETYWEERLRAAAGRETSGARDVADDGAAGDGAAAGAVEGLRSVARARADLLANVMPRAAFELMLLGFARVTLAEAPEEAPSRHA